MAEFSEDEITNLTDVMNTNSDILSYQLDLVAGMITDADKVRVLELYDAWVIADANYTDIEPKESNLGVRISARRQADTIALKIAKKLHCEELLEDSGSLTQGVVIPL